LSLWPSFGIVLVGGLASVMIMYVLGKRYGRDFFMRKDYKYFSVADIMRFERNLERWGGLLLVFSRFVVGFRSAIAVGAGIGRYHPVKMFVYSLISYVLFAGLLFYLALSVVENLDVLAYYFRTYNIIIWPLLGAAVLIWLIWKIRKVRGKA